MGLPLLFFRGSPGVRTLDTLTGLTAGIMVAAAFFSLLVPALDRGSLVGVTFGFALGVAFLAAVDDAVLAAHHARFAEPGRELDARTPARQRAILPAEVRAAGREGQPDGHALGQVVDRQRAEHRRHARARQRARLNQRQRR